MMPLQNARENTARLSNLPEVSHAGYHYCYGTGNYLVLVNLKGGVTVGLLNDESVTRWIRNYHHSVDEPRERQGP